MSLFRRPIATSGLLAVTPTGGIENKYETAPDAARSGWESFAPAGTA